MLRLSPIANALLTLVCVIAYVAAASVECERPDIVPSRSEVVALSHDAPTAALSHGEGHAPSAGHAKMAGHVHAPKGPAPAQAEHGHHAPGHEVMQPKTPAVHAAHEAHAGRGDAREPEAERSTVAGYALKLVLMPTCLCGCSETRALANGAAGSLGIAAVDAPAHLVMIAGPRPTPESLEGLFPNIDPRRDPLPI